jgi:hypothetical protein
MLRKLRQYTLSRCLPLHTASELDMEVVPVSIKSKEQQVILMALPTA